MNRLGEKIRILRKRRGVSAQELADAIGLSQTYIAKIENGDRRPSIDVVANLSRYFDVSTDVLILDELDL